MSQSDYLKHKKMATQLKIDNADFNPVLDAQQYTQFKKYQLNNTITSTNKQWSRLQPSGKQRIFSMDLDVSGCSSFLLCSGTDQRPHREAMLEIYKHKFPEPLTITERNEATNQKNGCDCGSVSSGNPCACALGRFGIVR